MKRTPAAASDTAQLAAALDRLVTQRGESLGDLSARKSVLLVFLRHAGCVFCRQTLSDLARERTAIESSGAHIVIVHMGDTAQLLPVLETYGLSAVDRICDEKQILYGAFGLKRGTLGQLFGPKAIWRGLVAALVGGHGFALPKADARQMPGVFLLQECSVTGRFRHESVCDRPHLAAIAGGVRHEK
jgi:peroxiredoxin